MSDRSGSGGVAIAVLRLVAWIVFATAIVFAYFRGADFGDVSIFDWFVFGAMLISSLAVSWYLGGSLGRAIADHRARNE